MPWTRTTRRDYERRDRRYASDATDREWSLIALLLPALKSIGRPRTTSLRGDLDPILCMATTGCQWQVPPNELPAALAVQIDQKTDTMHKYLKRIPTLAHNETNSPCLPEQHSR